MLKTNITALRWILLAAFLVFAPTLGTYFSQDDWVFLSHVYKQPLSSVFKHYPEAFYRPVGQQLLFYLSSVLFGLEAQGFHLATLAIHLFNVWLLSRVLNRWNPDRKLKYFLLAFYAVNPVHFVALNWLTQADIEVAMVFSLLTILCWRRSVLSLVLFLGAILSHETTVLLPIAIGFWDLKRQDLADHRGRLLSKAVIFLGVGVLVLVVKYVLNPFSTQSDYSVQADLLGVLSTLKWYALRALAIPEGIRNLPAWMMGLSLIPGLLLILIFRQKLVRGLGVYILGVLPVLGFGEHVLAAYGVFGVGLMVIELGRSKVAVRRQVWGFSTLVIMLSAITFVYTNYSNHWSTGRGEISRQLAEEYVVANAYVQKESKDKSRDTGNNPEVYFSTMMGRQFEVLDRGSYRGVFDFLFYRGNDITTQFLPDAMFFRESLLGGNIPLWNPWIFAGMPYVLDPQNFLWYPPNYLLLLMPLEVGFLVLLVGHLGFAFQMMNKILGNLGKLGYLGAVLFVLSPKLMGHLEEGNWSLVIAATWLPMLYWSLKNSKFWWTVISLSAVIINNLNIGYYSVLFVALYLLFRQGISKRSNLCAQRLDLKTLLAATAVLTLPRWLPLAMFGHQTVRATLQESPLPLWSWTKIAKSLALPLASGHPFLQNEEILYLGIVPVLLVIAYVFYKGLTFARKGQTLLSKGVILFWSLWIGFIFLISINNKTPLYYLINKFPGFSLLRITTRPWIFASLGVALAAPVVLAKIWKKSKILGVLGVLGVLGEYIVFGYGIFARREIPKDPLPGRFYQQMASQGTLTRAYCTTDCLDRLTAQTLGIALLGGNNPIQLTDFVSYLQRAAGYQESGYHPILPPYTVFNSRPQPSAELLRESGTKFVISPYELKDVDFKLQDNGNGYLLYSL